MQQLDFNCFQAVLFKFHVSRNVRVSNVLSPRFHGLVSNYVSWKQFAVVKTKKTYWKKALCCNTSTWQLFFTTQHCGRPGSTADISVRYCNPRILVQSVAVVA